MEYGVNMTALVNYNKDNETDNANGGKTEVIECYMEGPADIKWSVQINETKVAGIKSSSTGDCLEVVVHINLKKETKREDQIADR